MRRVGPDSLLGHEQPLAFVLHQDSGVGLEEALGRLRRGELGPGGLSDARAPLDGPLTFTGGATRSPYWTQLRTDILGRPVRLPEHPEPALGMAALACHAATGTPLTDVTDRMVRIRTTVHPRHTDRYTAPYLRLLDALESRGWLPGPVAAHARGRAERNTGGS